MAVFNPKGNFHLLDRACAFQILPLLGLWQGYRLAKAANHMTHQRDGSESITQSEQQKTSLAMACGILSGTFHWGRNKGPHLTLHIIQYALNFWCVELSSGMRGRFNHDLIRDPLSFGRDVASAIICSLLKLTFYLIPLKKPNLCFRVVQSLPTRVVQFKQSSQ